MRSKRFFFCVKQSQNNCVLNGIILTPFKSFKDFHLTFIVKLDIINHYTYSSISSIAILKQVSLHSLLENIAPFNNVRNSLKIFLCPKARTILYILRLHFRTMIHLYPHWHIFWSMNYMFKSITFLSETKYTWIVSIIYLSTLYDRFEFKILINIYSTECYIISNIPSTFILISISIRHNLSRSLHFLSFSGTWTIVKVLWNVMS